MKMDDNSLEYYAEQAEAVLRKNLKRQPTLEEIEKAVDILLLKGESEAIVIAGKSEDN